MSDQPVGRIITLPVNHSGPYLSPVIKQNQPKAKMKLFYVTNGWQHDLPISALVIAEDEDRAIVLARPLFIEMFEKRPYLMDREVISYHTLEATELCSDTAVEWVCQELGEGLYEK